ncbi:BTAD domain-containing putative transcriptional regulator [Blastococcus sp. TF02-8]|uniref:BTAD domain-containing putative transcriptional regulator n=1 Tax=Blastococcus sp. TF02-8 TaxID=2250574 RepID=UPI001412FFA9|nr:BTAD domain-containing putative transcriptional regulator [Blastococcus sp. TF02-8]
MPVRVCLLGPVAVLDEDGRAVDAGGPRARALLARLALEPGRVVGLDALVDAVWDGDPPAAPGNAVQALVSRLRRALPALSLLAQAHGYLVDLPAEAVDVARFEALVTRARGEREPERVVALLTEAEQLWRGPALGDLRDLAFTAAPAARWDELRLAAAEQRLEAQLALGDAAAVSAEIEELAAAHPTRETTVVLHVRTLAALGRPAQALAVYERCRALLADELGADPSPELRAAHLAVLRGEQDAPRDERMAPRRGNVLRTPLTSFRGRDDELALLTERLDSGRLVTLLGPGGAGKTRLALEAAHRRRADPVDGVWWVELAPVADARLVPTAVLAAVGQRESTSVERVPTVVEASDRLQEVFADRQALLVLDNCEHLVAAVAQLTDELLAHCPRLRVLTTSREPLGVPGESLLPVGPLEVPGPDDPDAERAPVVRLFADRAVAVRPDFTVSAVTLPAVLDICRRLDGMPLALELAAARLRTLGVAQIAARLDDRFELLTGGSRVALPRHQTLRAVVEWSWDALDERERVLARRLSVFAGGATLDAVEEVCAEPGWSPAAVLDAISGLVEKSLLVAVEDADGAVRYRMLETIRAYGAEQLDEAAERARVEEAQVGWCLRLVDALDPLLRGPDQLVALRRLHAEHDGLLAVLQRAVTVGDEATAVHPGARLSWFWMLSGRQVAGFRRLGQVIDLPGGPSPQRTVCAVFAAVGQAEGGDWDAMLPRLREITELPAEVTWASTEPLAALGWGIATVFAGGFRSLDALSALDDHEDPWVIAAARGVRTQVAENVGELDGLEAELGEAHAQFRRLGDRWGRAFAAGALAQVHATDEELERAIACYTEAIELSEELGTVDDTLSMRIRRSLVRAALGDVDAARAEAEDVRRAVESDGGLQLAFAEAALGGLALLDGRVEEAERRQRQAVARIAATTGGPPQIGAMAHAGLGVVLAARAERDPGSGDTAREAAAELATALDLAVRHAADMPVAAVVVQGLAALALAAGDPRRAATLLGMATVVRGRRDRGELIGRMVDQRVRRLLGEEETERLHAAGATPSRAEVFAELGVEWTGEWPAAAQTRRR